MRPLLVIEQEWRLAGLGLLGHRLDAAGVPYRRFRAWEHRFEDVDLRDYSGIVPLGGSAHAWEDESHPYLRHERRLLADAVEGGRPVLAICLGAQLLARVLGAEVREGGRHEVGWQEIRPVEGARDDPLLGHLAGPVGVYQWHMDAFELPAGASRLAESGMFPNQAFRYGSAWGVQFHPEVDYATFRVWLANHPGVCEQLGIDEPGLDAAVLEGSLRDLGWRSELFDRFAALVAASEAPGS
ncbi:MAG: type 1 glutamine amidotransferase [Gaiellales bacterium]